MKTPIISKVYPDPSRRIPLIKKFEKEAFKRFRLLKKEIKAMLLEKLKPAFVINADWDYSRMNGRQLAELQEAIAYLINDILNGGDMNYEHWVGYFIEHTYEDGTKAAFNNIASQSVLVSESATLNTILFSDVYQTRLGMVLTQEYAEWTSITESIRGELNAILGQAIADGIHPDEIAKQISDRSETLRWKAQRFARTELLSAYRRARINEAERDEEQYGVKIGYLWISALSPTTRKWHAARHGRIYTAKEIQEFYREKNGSNRYNCRCSFTEVVFEDGKADVSPALEKRLKEQREKWVAHLS